MLGISGFNISITTILCCCGAPKFRDADKLEKFANYERKSLLQSGHFNQSSLHPCLSFFSTFLNPHQNPSKGLKSLREITKDTNYT